MVWTHFAVYQWGSSLMTWYTGWYALYQMLVMMVLARTQMFYHDAPEALEAIKLGWVFAVSILGVAVVVEMRMERMRKKEEVARLKEEKSRIEERLRNEKVKGKDEMQTGGTTTKRKGTVAELEKEDKEGSKEKLVKSNKKKGTAEELEKEEKEGSKEKLVKSNKKKDTTKEPEPSQKSKPTTSTVPPKPPAPPKPQTQKKPLEKTPNPSQTANAPKNAGKNLSLIDEIKAFNRKELKRREEREKVAKPQEGIYGALSVRLESIRNAVGLGEETEDVGLISEEWKD